MKVLPVSVKKILYKYRFSKTNNIAFTEESYAKLNNITVKTAKKHIKLLKEAGLIVKKDDKKYHFINHRSSKIRELYILSVYEMPKEKFNRFKYAELNGVSLRTANAHIKILFEEGYIEKLNNKGEYQPKITSRCEKISKKEKNVVEIKKKSRKVFKNY